MLSLYSYGKLLNILINSRKKISLKIPKWHSESLFYAFNFNVQNYNVIAIENVFLLSVLKMRFQDRIYKWKKWMKCECLNMYQNMSYTTLS